MEELDGICIYTNKSYKRRQYTGPWWMGVIKGYNISNNKDRSLDKYGTPLSCIAINREIFIELLF